MRRRAPAPVLMLLLVGVACSSREPDPPIIGVGSAGIAVDPALPEFSSPRRTAPLPQEEAEARSAAAALPATPFQTPPNFPVPFTTNVPEGMVASTDPLEHAVAARFALRSVDGVPVIGDAFVYVYFYPPDLRVMDALTLIRGEADRAGSRNIDGPLLPWTLEERAYAYDTQSGQRILGTIALGRFSRGYYHVAIEYPTQWEAAFLPRARRVLDDWRWSNTTSRVVPES